MNEPETGLEEARRRSWLARVMVALAITMIRWYQVIVSPLIGPSCRFTPTCSGYAIGAIRKYGVLSGCWRAVKRIARCHPWNPGGYDPP